MGRTALNVNDAIVTGVVVAKWENALDPQGLQQEA